MKKTPLSRRDWLKSAGSSGLVLASGVFRPKLVWADQKTNVIDIGSRRELFVDDYLIDRTEEARRVLHHPTPREVCLVRNKPWEGNTCSYTTVFQDGELYRMYYRGTNREFGPGQAASTHREVTCYAESTDGIRWTKPELGLVEFNGSKKNNIIWDGAGSHNFAPFKDPNPDCRPEACYKAVGGLRRQGGLFAFGSPDAIHWSLISDQPVITKGAFDSQNVVFWDVLRGEYRAYVRDFRDGIRDIRTCTSRDFVDWSDPVFLKYADNAPTRGSQFYTNAILPYYRAPHLFLGFPARYVDYAWAESTRQLPQRTYRELIATSSRRSGTAFHDTMLMSSRDGLHFDVWPESFIRPGIQRPGSWFYGDSRQNWGLVETKSPFPGASNDLSIYVSEARYQPDGNRLRRYTLRVDGFVSLQALMAGGEVVTNPLRFQGHQLKINFSTSAAGSIRVEIQDAHGDPIPGFTLADCREQFGDELDRVVSWKQRTDVSGLSDKTVRLRFELKDADLYSFQFTENTTP